MRTFEYRALDAAGSACRGLIEADDPKDARARLAARGVYAVRLSAAGRAGGAGTGRGAFSRPAPRSAVYRELASLIRAGLPMTRALDVLIDSPEWDGCRGTLAGIRDRIKEGEDPARAVSEAGALPVFESALLEAGRRAGALDAGMDRAASHLEEGIRIRDRLLAATVYPAVIGAIALLAAGLILGILLPAFARIWEESGAELPALTRFLLSSGRILRRAAPAAAAAGVAAWLLLRRGRAARRLARTLDRRIFGAPLIGRARSALSALRVARTLHLLLESGTQLVEALQIAGRASGSRWIEARLAEEAEAVRHGDRLSTAFRRIPPLAGPLAGWVEAGEIGGELPAMLDRAAARAAGAWERSVSRAMSFLEPALLLLLGAFVFLVALSVLLPILSLNRSLGGL